MLRLGVRLLQPLSVLAADKSKGFWNFNRLKYTLVPLAGTSIYYFLHRRDFAYYQTDDHIQTEHLFDQARRNTVVEAAKYVARFIQLGFIFAPTLLCLPLCLFDSTRELWINIFLNAVQRAGIVWIKTFQYLSHRRDIIGEEMAHKFAVLRENSPEHHLQQTVETIQRVYGKSIEQLFQDFDYTPIASGSVSQVYKAMMHGKDVAVKVRHPNIGHNLTRDIQLLFKISRFFAFFSNFFAIPVTPVSLKRILSEQLFFLKQKRNLEIFKATFNEDNINFPEVYPESTNEVLIEEFIDGKTISFYGDNMHNLNKVIASVGAKAFFSMLMKYNLVHADCHGGNILVKIKEVPDSLVEKASEMLENVKNYAISKAIKFGFNSEYLQQLSQDHYEYEMGIFGDAQKYHQKVKITLIDLGMAISLTEVKKKDLQNFFEVIIKGDPLECAKWIYHVSMKKNGLPLTENENPKYFADLQVMFKRVHLTALENLQAIVVLKEMLEVIRNHNMMIDGQISILLTNMLVLEAIAKDLDPNINILRCAVPFLQYK